MKIRLRGRKVNMLTRWMTEMLPGRAFSAAYIGFIQVYANLIYIYCIFKRMIEL